jgi:non-heme chloroperoxidase
LTLLLGMALFIAVMVSVVGVAVAMVATSPGPETEEKDVFGFASLQPTPESNLPPLLRYPARDGEQLAYRFYDSSADQC